MQGKRTLTPSTFLHNYAPLKIFIFISCPQYNLKNRQRYFRGTGYKNKLLSDNVQRTKTEKPPTIFVKLCPFEIFLIKVLSAALSLS